MQPTGALKGITVLDLSRLLPGPFCSMILADHGARVIAIEDKRYAAEAGGNLQVMRNKAHITLNLKSEAGRNIFLNMADRADVVLEGFRPGVVDRLGVGYEAVSAKNPGIIYCAISGYGQTGPRRDMAGHDANYLSAAGVLDIMGEKGRPPAIPGIQIADLAGGGMNAVIGILLALHVRNQTGKGQYIDISMTDGSLSLMSLVLSLKQLTGLPVNRGDSFLSHRYACYNTYETADGRYLSIGAVENRFWKNLCDFFEKPEYGPLQYDDARRGEMIDFMKRRFREKTLDQWRLDLDGRDICWGPVQTLDEALADPMFQEREMVVGLSGENGREGKFLGVPVKLGDTPGQVRTRPPAFGQDTETILKEFGYSEDEIQSFAANGVI